MKFGNFFHKRREVGEDKEEQGKLHLSEDEASKIELRKSYSSSTPEENTLETREPEKKNRLAGGSNQVMLVELKDDGSGVFKPKGGETLGLRNHVEVGTYFKRERAAYLVDKFLGFGLIPPTIIREIDGDRGSVQQFIPDAKSGFTTNDVELQAPKVAIQLDKLAILDYLILNSDRHGGNFLLAKDKIYAIDNGLTFGNDYLLSSGRLLNKPISLEMQERIGKFLSWEEGKEILRDFLLELLDQVEVDAFLKRLENVGEWVRSGKTPERIEKDYGFSKDEDEK